MFPQILATAALLPLRVNLLSLMTFFCYWVGKSALCLSAPVDSVLTFPIQTMKNMMFSKFF